MSVLAVVLAAITASVVALVVVLANTEPYGEPTPPVTYQLDLDPTTTVGICADRVCAP